MDLKWVDWDRFWVIVNTYRKERNYPIFSHQTCADIKYELLRYQDRNFTSGYIAAFYNAFKIPFKNLPKWLSSEDVFINPVVRYRLEAGQ